MPISNVARFGARNSTGGCREVWRWADDDNDAALVAWVQSYSQPSSGSYGDVTVDRSGSVPTLRWQIYQQNWDWETETATYSPIGQFGSIELAAGLFINPTHYYAWPDPRRAEPGIQDTTGWWESDQHGRPFDLNDLLAES